jgi:hypothetical protein
MGTTRRPRRRPEPDDNAPDDASKIAVLGDRRLRLPSTAMIDKLRDRLPGHTHTQRLGMLRFTFSEVRLRCALYAPPVALDDSGKPRQPSPSELAFVEDELAAALDG